MFKLTTEKTGFFHKFSYGKVENSVQLIQFCHGSNRWDPSCLKNHVPIMFTNMTKGHLETS